MAKTGADGGESTLKWGLQGTPSPRPSKPGGSLGFRSLCVQVLQNEYKCLNHGHVGKPQPVAGGSRLPSWFQAQPCLLSSAHSAEELPAQGREGKLKEASRCGSAGEPRPPHLALSKGGKGLRRRMGGSPGEPPEKKRRGGGGGLENGSGSPSACNRKSRAAGLEQLRKR